MAKITIDGIINLNKPIGITSAKALYKVRAVTGVRKSGHTGTLDPGADGVLVLCLGKATKLVERVMDQPKVYRTTARLDVTSESFDSDRPHQKVTVADVPDRDAVAGALRSFEGEIDQIPPAISAIKVGGVPAYKLARQDRSPRLASRRVRIYWTQLWSFDWPVVTFSVCCGRGTYVRSLIRDLGKRLGTGGCLTGLTREAVGPFRVSDAWTIEQMETGDAADYILPLAAALALLEGNSGEVPARPTG